MRARPISPDLLVEHIAEAVDSLSRPPGTRLAVGIDGAGPTGTDVLAERLVEALRLRGRQAVHVAARDYLRPASLRFELGRHDPDVFYTEWLDLKALDREVLAPIGPDGNGMVLPRLWDAAADRAYRAQYVQLGPGGVVLVEGSLLFGVGLAFDLTVHLSMSAAALARRTADEDAWTLPAYQRYEEEQQPVETSDIAVRCDDPRHPAIVTRDE
ncbi:uridine kinase [Actinospica robiniae]|uniref:uridine kinase n=1 Tax=Actinospica robiniae TaxID=304901 RepID=UPI00040A7665|nr:uridine kinase [Actinospica robiniae]